MRLDQCTLGRLTNTTGVGTKARNLDTMLKAGLRVPAGIVLPAAQLWGWLLPERPMPSALQARIASAGRLRSVIWSTSIDRLGTALAELTAELREPFVVRSSSAIEDGRECSSAGLFRSVVGVHRDDLARSVRDVWGSGFSSVVLALHGEVPMDHNAVIVQEQLEPLVAGVCFSVDPTRAWSGDLVVECVEGLAADLLEGTASGTQYRISRSEWAVTRPADGPMTDELSRV